MFHRRRSSPQISIPPLTSGKLRPSSPSRRTLEVIKSTLKVHVRRHGLPRLFFCCGLACLILNVVYRGMCNGLKSRTTTATTRAKSDFASKPQIVSYDFESSETVRLARGLLPQIDRRQERHLQHPNRFVESESFEEEESDDELGNCKPMHEWQKMSYVMCNPFHELDMRRGARDGDLSYIASGGDRSAWKIQDIEGNEFALKTRIYTNDIYPTDFERSRIDGMTLEHLTASPYVLSTYGYCGLSHAVELSQGGATYDLIRRSRDAGHDIISPLNKLKVMYQMTTAVADLHDHDIVHQDLCCHQFILIDGVYKLNDFHLARWLRHDPSTQEVCREYLDYSWDYWVIRAPEDDPEELCQLTKSDDYTIGNVMYNVYTRKWLFEGTDAHHDYDKVLRNLRLGKRSPIPQHLLQSKDPADQAAQHAIRMAWEHDVAKRPTAREVSNFLRHEIEKIEGKPLPKVVRISVPPLPKDYRYTDSDCWPD